MDTTLLVNLIGAISTIASVGVMVWVSRMAVRSYHAQRKFAMLLSSSPKGTSLLNLLIRISQASDTKIAQSLRDKFKVEAEAILQMLTPDDRQFVAQGLLQASLQGRERYLLKVMSLGEIAESKPVPAQDSSESTPIEGPSQGYEKVTPPAPPNQNRTDYGTAENRLADLSVLIPTEPTF